MSFDRLVLPLLTLAIIALGLGVFLPVVEVRNLVIFANRFSIMEAAWQLLIDEQYLLGLVVIVFSIVFPFGKIMVAAIVWARFETRGTSRLLGFRGWSSSAAGPAQMYCWLPW